MEKQELVAARLYNSGLVVPFDNAEICAKNLIGIQAQAQQFAGVALLNRVSSLKPEHLKDLYNSYRLIKVWGQRMTVHMYSPEDWKIIKLIYAPRNNFVKRGWDGNEHILSEILNEIESVSREKGKISKKEIEEIIERHAKHIDNGYKYYSVIQKATLDSIIFGIPQMPHTKVFAHRHKCVKDTHFFTWDTEKESILQNLLLRYFSAYGPASLSDFLHWSGLTKKEVQESFYTICPQLTEVIVNGKTLFCNSNIELELDNYQEVKLLGKFDPLFVCYSDKSWIATPEQQKAIWMSAARVEAVVISGTELVGTWRYVSKGNKLDFNIFVFRSLLPKEKNMIEQEANKIAAFFNKAPNNFVYTKY